MIKKTLFFLFFLSFSAQSAFLQNPVIRNNNNQIFIKNQFIFSSSFSKNQFFNTSLFLNTITYKPYLSAWSFDILLAAQNNNFSQNFQPLSAFAVHYNPDDSFKIDFQYTPQSDRSSLSVLPSLNFNLQKSFFNDTVTFYVHYGR